MLRIPVLHLEVHGFLDCLEVLALSMEAACRPGDPAFSYVELRRRTSFQAGQRLTFGFCNLVMAKRKEVNSSYK